MLFKFGQERALCRHVPATQTVCPVTDSFAGGKGQQLTCSVAHLTGGLRAQTSAIMATITGSWSTAAKGNALQIFTRCCTQNRTTCSRRLRGYVTAHS